jgi:hypothetical protein
MSLFQFLRRFSLSIRGWQAYGQGAVSGPDLVVTVLQDLSICDDEIVFVLP